MLVIDIPDDEDNEVLGGASLITADQVKLEYAKKEEEENRDKIVMRLRKVTWEGRRGLYRKFELTWVTTQCKGRNRLKECMRKHGELCYDDIINLQECEAGLYEVVLANVNRDWDTGKIIDHQFKLVEMADPNSRYNRNLKRRRK